ncbi:MAG: dienelactone hydrolase family protein [Bacteroidota bacterium]
MKMYPILLAFLLIGLSYSCDNTPKPAEAESMADLAEDSTFQNKHELPEEMAFKGKGTILEFATDSEQPGTAYALMTEEPSDKYLLVIHEWWGLNDQIKQEADRLFADLGDVNVMALDLYDGNVASSRDKASEYMQSREQERLESIVRGAIAKAGEDAQIATIGWCFGGGWSLRSSILAEDQGVGCVMYYGMPVKEATELAPLQTDVLGIFAKKDKYINEEVVNQFRALAAATGKQIDVHWFDADHAFANPSSPRYVEEAAQKANQLALEFLQNRFQS